MTEKPTGGVQSVERALTLLELMAATEDGARLSDLARSAGLAASTAHRLLTTLEQRGFAQSDAASGRWHIGQRSFAVGSAYTRQRNFVVPALPFLRRLRDMTRETANLGVIENGEVVTLSQVESREIMRAISPPGGRVPVLCSGMGKAILATWEDAAIDRLIDRHGLRAMTPRSLTDRAAVHKEIGLVRARGYALDDEEFVLGLRCVAAVVWSPQAEAACAISVSGLAARMTPEKVAETGTIVMRLAAELTATLGGRPPE
ncbi:IclR family transcriptional regulator [Thalassovita taeanensis]|uniref:Transcriptional regulator, IclR family n=1 Tax=Thalassovita taeanensis TaxID=657014 RepID=A0A1H9IGB7_9RHOB|nr:IclR family transcriptional regulator C-terminal domain-containing protein [Thalassovita taeanensis]SEQ73619.1 transcriptional regulator, IclR family [Thalassovita taeanensis]